MDMIADPAPGPTREAAAPHCRFCAAPLGRTVVDLGAQPNANSYLRGERLHSAMEPTWPLHVYVCESCLLVQIASLHTTDELFGDYAYFSSYSDSWLRHAERYAADMIGRFGVGTGSLVVEVASNDGYLLQYFRRAGVPVLGIDPAANVARAAIERGIPTLVRGFGRETAAHLARERLQADLIAANNVLAHVPDVNDFVAGFAAALKPAGVLTVEFPHLLNLIAENQFDTIYHEHFSYYSLSVVKRIFAAHGLQVFDVEELPTHGGSLRVFACRSDQPRPVERAVDELLARESGAGLNDPETYSAFARRAAWVKRELLSLLIDVKDSGKTIAAYGAPAKGNTLLNFCGIRGDFVDYTVDRNPVKQGTYLPGSRIPVHAPEMLRETRPDYLLILPWNLKAEIMESCAFIREWGGRFIVPIPEPRVVD